MKVFISWSGELSRNVAELLSEWLKNVLQGVQTWISTDDIQKGSIWFADIGEQLSQTKIGVLCLTPDNITAPWVLFEAGALCQGLGTPPVCPLLVNLSHTELKPPLSQFNGTLPQKDDMLKLVRTINQAATASPLDEQRLVKAFGTWWGAFESDYKLLVGKHQPKKAVAKRSQEDVLAEILEVTRSVQSLLQRNQPANNPRVVLKLPDDQSRTGTLPTWDKLMGVYFPSDESEETKLDRIVARRIGEILLKGRLDPEQNQKETVERILAEYLLSTYGSRPADNPSVPVANPELKPGDASNPNKRAESQHTPETKNESDGKQRKER